MLLKLKIVDRFSLKLVDNCEIEVTCLNHSLKDNCNGELVVKIPDDCTNFFRNIDAPMYKSVSYSISRMEKNNERVIGLDIVDLLEEDPVTA